LNKEFILNFLLFRLLTLSVMSTNLLKQKNFVQSMVTFRFYKFKLFTQETDFRGEWQWLGQGAKGTSQRLDFPSKGVIFSK